MKNDKKIWFTSDTHYSHKNIIKFSNRPFDNVDEMDEAMINTWNRVVNEDDDVYHLGDFAFTNQKKIKEIINRLNGNIHLIIGNHEKSITRKQSVIDLFVWVKPYHEMYINKQFIVLCHYAMRVWNKSHHGAFHLYGHSHDSMEHEPWGRSMDVGVDSAYRLLGEYRPFSFEEINKIMSTRGHNPVDHHIMNK